MFQDIYYKKGEEGVRREWSLAMLGMLNFSTKSKIWEKLAKAEDGMNRRLAFHVCGDYRKVQKKSKSYELQ